MEKTNTDRDRCTGCGGCKNASHTGYAQCLLSLAARCSCAQQGTPAKEHDGTIPLSEALAAIDRGESVEAQFMEDGAWNKLTRDCRLAIGCLTQPSTRFRLAPPSRLKALATHMLERVAWTLTDCTHEGATAKLLADREGLAQAVTRDIIAYLRGGAEHSEVLAAADDIERSYLGGGK